jgi:hypothetical protein
LEPLLLFGAFSCWMIRGFSLNFLFSAWVCDLPDLDEARGTKQDRAGEAMARPEASARPQGADSISAATVPAMLCNAEGQREYLSFSKPWSGIEI